MAMASSCANIGLQQAFRPSNSTSSTVVGVNLPGRLFSRRFPSPCQRKSHGFPCFKVGSGRQSPENDHSQQRALEISPDALNAKAESDSESETASVFNLSVAQLIPAWALVSCPTAFAGVTKYTNEEWVQIWITSGIVFFSYLIVLPLIIYNYLRLRWYKRKLAETIFQFLLVFLFFPGLLLLAPFINFRRFPRDPSMKDPWS
uniref:Uncharacterized protein n=1 Tax=Araucaria cunninghamii TaxID=56994 RepID=A0A0D6R3X5_ARACU